MPTSKEALFALLAGLAMIAIPAALIVFALRECAIPNASSVEAMFGPCLLK